MGARKIKETMTRWTPSRADPHPPSSPLSKLGSQTISGAKRRRRRRALDSINTLLHTHIEGGDHKATPQNTHTHTHTHTHTQTHTHPLSRTAELTASINEIA
jgi:hypothetical protein